METNNGIETEILEWLRKRAGGWERRNSEKYKIVSSVQKGKNERQKQCWRSYFETVVSLYKPYSTCSQPATVHLKEAIFHNNQIQNTFDKVL